MITWNGVFTSCFRMLFLNTACFILSCCTRIKSVTMWGRLIGGIGGGDGLMGEDSILVGRRKGGCESRNRNDNVYLTIFRNQNSSSLCYRLYISSFDFRGKR